MNSLKSGSSLIRVPAMMRSNKFRHDGDTVCSAMETSRTSPTTVMQGASFYHHFHASHDHRIALEVAVHVKTCNAGPCGAFRRRSAADSPDDPIRVIAIGSLTTTCTRTLWMWS